MPIVAELGEQVGLRTVVQLDLVGIVVAEIEEPLVAEIVGRF